MNSYDLRNNEMEELLETLYSGIVNVRDWELFCKKLGKMFFAHSTSILSINKQSNESKFTASYGISLETQELLLKFLPCDDPRISFAKKHLNESCILNSDTLIDRDNNLLLSSYAIYSEVFMAELIEHHLILCISIDQFEDIYIILGRKSDNDSFKQDDVNILNNLQAHIFRSVRIQKKHTANDIYIRAGLNALKHQPVGSIVVNSESLIFHLNEYAKSIIDKKEGLIIINKHIYHKNNDKIKLLSDVIDLTLDSAQIYSTSIVRDYPAKPYQIRVKQFDTRRSPFQSQYPSKNMIHISIIDPEKPMIMTSTLLENIFSLTASEARVASSLAKNCNLKSTQSELNISANTARTHLKKIFSKMNVSSQVELVKLITTSYLWSSEE